MVSIRYLISLLTTYEYTTNPLSLLTLSEGAIPLVGARGRTVLLKGSQRHAAVKQGAIAREETLPSEGAARTRSLHNYRSVRYAIETAPLPEACQHKGQPDQDTCTLTHISPPSRRPAPSCMYGSFRRSPLLLLRTIHTPIFNTMSWHTTV